MSHTNSTKNYGLPQFITTDKPAWLTDINVAFGTIDTAVKAAKDSGDDAQGDATQALQDAAAASSAAAAADAKGAGASASIADTFDPTATYAIGDLVMYNSLFYRCIAPITTPGPWSSVTNWTRITVEEIVPKYGTDLAMSSDNSHTVTEMINGMVVKLNAAWIAQSSSAYNTALTDSINVSEGIWLITWGHPNQTGNLTAYVEGISTNSDVSDQFMTADNGLALDKSTILVRFFGNATITLRSAGSTNVAFSDTSRGFLRAVKLKTFIG